MNKTFLKKAEEFCAAHKHRLTEPRLEVLKIIATSKKPLGAYDILEQLSKTIRDPKPPTAYRAIEFWQEQGFIHRIESLNAYVICEAGHHHSGSQFMICGSCGDVTEAHLCDLPKDFKKTLATKGFTAKSWNMELHGTCGACVGK
jgi:Fur family zinc uptake transcriptional regulator